MSRGRENANLSVWRESHKTAARIKVTLQLKPFIEAKAAEVRKATEGRPKKLSTKSSEVIPIDTRKELAATAGVSEDTFRKAEAVLKTDNEEVKKEMLFPPRRE